MRATNLTIRLEDIGIPLAVFTGDGRCVEINNLFRQRLGYSSADLKELQFQRLCRTDGATTSDDLFARFVETGRDMHQFEARIRHSDGSHSPTRIALSLQMDPVSGERYVLAAFEDVTGLRKAEIALAQSEAARHDLARKLTTAQERERSRIARELHDDIGQWLAILRIQFLRAGKPVSGLPDKRHPGVAELCDELRKVASKVSKLSHQLHSPELEYLGLASAIQSHCREFSEKYKIPVECSCRDLNKDIDSLLALSLLRVVQEALHNSAKYSQATQIKVDLRQTNGELGLEIADNGVGFDLEEARLSAGLGLISMRERINLSGGEFVIASQPGKGTKISARVPLVANNESSAC